MVAVESAPVVESAPTIVVPTAEERVLDAAVHCVARWGLAKTTLDDVAREAGLSRATVYRLVPGGKPALMQQAGQREVGRLLADLQDTIASAGTLEDVVVDGLVAAYRSMLEHEALRHLLAHEAEVVRPFLAFDSLRPALQLAADACTPALVRFVPPDAAAELVEHCARLLLSLTFVPGPVDLSDEHDVRRYVRAYVLPGVELLAGPLDAVHPSATNHHQP